eukprot:404967-Prorocentrum_minimum.AAC.1
MASSSSAGMQRWELENNVAEIGPEVDAIFKYDEVQQSAIQAQKPWTKDPHYFKHWMGACSFLLRTSRASYIQGGILHIAQKRFLVGRVVFTSARSRGCFQLVRIRGFTSTTCEPLKYPNDRLSLRSVKVSALALLKMAMHCRSGGNLEGEAHVARTLVVSSVQGLQLHANPSKGLR